MDDVMDAVMDLMDFAACFRCVMDLVGLPRS